VWKRTVKGRALHFYLAGINNQNFLMRDRETGTWWQQITGKALYGPLQGETLDLVLSDELTFGEWRREFPAGRVLAPVPKYAKEYDAGWEPKVAKLPVVISFPGTQLKSRDVVIGVAIDGAARAYPWDRFTKDSPVIDHLNGTPLLLVLGPDGKSFRVFLSRVAGRETEFFLRTDTTAADTSSDKESSEKKPWSLIDSSGSEWNFQGCAISGPAQGKCLDRVYALKDYWFDWRNYHPGTSVYRRE
jgi:Protein of unknown function (DUF3179)